MTTRVALIHAVAAGAGGILFTCSAFGPAIDAAAVRVSVPVLKPNEAMFEKALATGRQIGMLATFAPSVASMAAEFREMAAARDRDARLESYCVPGAMAAMWRRTTGLLPRRRGALPIATPCCSLIFRPRAPRRQSAPHWTGRC
jgi:hypothetical protein